MEMVFSPAELSSWRLRGEAAHRGAVEALPIPELQPTGLREQQGLPWPLPLLWQQARLVLHPTAPAAWQELLQQWRQGFQPIPWPEESSMAMLKQQRGWVVLPEAKCQVTALLYQ